MEWVFGLVCEESLLGSNYLIRTISLNYNDMNPIGV
jgi:hypothetical protein